MTASLGVGGIEWDYPCMAMFLCNERRLGTESEWAPFINSLPVEYSNMPNNYNNEERTYLSGTSLEKMVQSGDYWIEQEYKQICDLGVCKNISINDYKWGIMTCLYVTLRIYTPS